ncbi:MAG: hypothetical protein E6667_11195, partial [Acinetobacter junii]|nr:hypothetical protein [Acinetobacter junii]
MNLEQYLHRQQVEKEATEAATRSVNEIVRKVSMFKVGDFVLYEKTYYTYEVVETTITNVFALKHSKTKRIYAMPHISRLKLASPEEIAAGHRIDTNTGVTVITTSGTSKVKGGLTAFIDMGDDSHIEN